jgi:hypothetical protein
MKFQGNIFWDIMDTHETKIINNIQTKEKVKENDLANVTSFIVL